MLWILKFLRPFMAHRHYHTVGFILKHNLYRDQDAVLTLFCRDFGLIRASARSLKASNSKLRLHSNRFNQVALSLVAGREFWRVVSMESTGLMDFLSQAPKTMTLVNRIFSLVERLSGGEEAMPEVYADLDQAFTFLGEVKFRTDSKFGRYLESLVVLRLLHHMGYLPALDLVQPFVKPTSITSELVWSLGPVECPIIQLINQTFTAVSV